MDERAEASMVVRQAVTADFEGILALQRDNVAQGMSAAQRRQGYIVSQMDRAQLAALNAGLGIMVAEQDGTLAGFVCLSTTDARPRPPVVDALLEAAASAKLDGIALAGRRLFLYGPVCVAARYRGKGVLRRLFEAARAHVRGRFDVGLAFIAADNPHSLAAHVEGLGMRDAARFHAAGKSYHLVAFGV